MIERLIVCQGTAQLVTAVAALRQHEARGTKYECAPRGRDHLLICGLAVVESQATAFTAVIERMARLLHPFATISRIGDDMLEQLLDQASRMSTAGEVAALLQRVTNIDRVDEVFTVRDWQSCNTLVLSAYPDAAHICYGDSVGVYLPRGFMAGAPTAWSRAKGLLRRLTSSRSALLDYPRVDTSYLLLPGAFGAPPGGQVIQTDVAPLRELFGCLQPMLEDAAMSELRRRTAGKPLWVLMGSNFSEQGMMTLDGEIAAYRAWIERLQPDPGIVLLIKSHPRDRVGKREQLEQGLRSLFSEVLSADGAGGAYLPVEAVLLDLVPRVASLQSLTVSTACLAAHFVLGSRTHIGFGDELVTKYVVAGRRTERCQHESDLRRLCAA